MTGLAHRAIGLCLILVLMGSLMTRAAWAEDGSRDRDKPIRLYAEAAFGPIGALSWNPPGSKVTINGRLAYGEQAIWNGDEIETTGGPNIRILLNSTGQVTLTGGARARLATTLTRLDDEVTARVLIASLISGDMMVKLQQEAVAYVEACGLAYTSSRGASFRIGIREGPAMVDAVSGTLDLQEFRPTIVTNFGPQMPSGPVQPLSPPPFTQASTKDAKTASIHTRRRIKRRTTTRNVLFAQDTGATQGQVTEIEEPAPFRKVEFKINPLIASITPNPVQTDANGEATVTLTFIAGNNPRPVNIVAEVIKESPEEITIPLPWTVKFVKAPPVLRNSLIGTAAAAALIIIFIPKDGNKGPVMLGSPTSKP